MNASGIVLILDWQPEIIQITMSPENTFTPYQQFKLNREAREKLLSQNSMMIWFTGLSGSGKSTIADLVEIELHNKGILTYSLDGDNVRNGINGDLKFSDEDRAENIRRIAEIGRLFNEAGVVTLASFISPFRKDREFVQNTVGADKYFEVFVNTPLETCEQRDVKGLYKKARSGEIPHFTGITSPYEIPLNPDLNIDTSAMNKEQCAELVVQSVINKILK